MNIVNKVCTSIPPVAEVDDPIDPDAPQREGKPLPYENDGVRRGRVSRPAATPRVIARSEVTWQSPGFSDRPFERELAGDQWSPLRMGFGAGYGTRAARVGPPLGGYWGRMTS